MKIFLGIVILATAGYFGSKGYLHHRVGESVDMAVIMMSPYADIEYEGISSTMTGELTVDGIVATVNGFRDPVYIDSIGIDTPSYFSLLSLSDLMAKHGAGAPEPPDEFGFLVKGFRVGAASDVYRRMYQFRLDAMGATDADSAAAQCVGKYGFSPAALAGLGYDEQSVSASFRFRNADTHYSLEVDAETRDMWQFAMSIVFDGNMLNEVSKGTAYRPALRSMEMEYTDRSLNGRIREYCSALGLSGDEIIQAHMESLNFLGESNGIVFDEYVVEPYLDFLAGKSTIVFKAEPHKPVRFSQLGLYKPEDVPALLNLSASVL